MAIKTTLEQLEEVQAAISAVMAGQAYSIAGRSVTKANLVALNDREAMLMQRYQRETGQGAAVINIGTMRRD